MRPEQVPSSAVRIRSLESLDGKVNISDYERMFDKSTGLVSVMYVNNEIGTIQPIPALIKIAHRHNCLFHTDAVQAVGHIKINVRELDIDLLSASAHKFNGPKGIGFLFVRRGLEINPLIDGGRQENGHRAGTENVAAIVAMAVALKNNCKNMEENASKLLTLEKKLIIGLYSLGMDYVRNGSEDHIPGNVNLSIKGFDGETLLHRLDLMGIYISTGAACDSINTRVSHVIEAISVPKEYALGTIRISLGKDNTEKDIDIIINAFQKIINEH